MKKPNNDFGMKLRLLRIERGLSQEKVAKYLYCATSYISSTELGKRKLTLKNLNKIIELFQLTPLEACELKSLWKIQLQIDIDRIIIPLRTMDPDKKALAIFFANEFSKGNIDGEKRKAIIKILNDEI